MIGLLKIFSTKIFLLCDIINAKHYFFDFLKKKLSKKCPYSEFFWSVFSLVRTEYKEIHSISPYSVRMLENTALKNSKYKNFSGSGRNNLFSLSYISHCNLKQLSDWHWTSLSNFTLYSHFLLISGFNFIPHFRSSHPEVFWKYATDLQKNTHAEVWFQ